MSVVRASSLLCLNSPRCVVLRAPVSRRSLATHTRIPRDPAQKYVPYTPVNLPNRKWPSEVLQSPPIWLSTDLRDGNQALPNPMSLDQKRRFFDLLVQVGFKEIEVAFPSASEVEFGFVRSLIQDGLVPNDVWLQVLSPCRPELIRRTMESIAGAKRAIIHIYAGVAPVFRDVVFQKSRQETIYLAIKHTALVRDLTEEYAERYGTQFRLNYGVEGFSQAEPEFALELCEEVKRTWRKAGPGSSRLSFNLAASVEIAPPNHFADQIEYFSRNISEREKVIVSLHPHNDMGTAVAAAQMGLLAGADRVEGCLLGQGERTGNVDIITLALNQWGQGIHPRLDFSDLPHVVKVVEECTGLPVHPRFPYSGNLVFTAFSGSHQDAIKKGFELQEKRHAENLTNGEPQRWSIPYLPFDPADVGCSYKALIRVNSQSGKAGIASLLNQALSIQLPRGMQIAFYQVIQKEAERTGSEVSLDTIVRSFRETYHLGREPRFAGRVILDSFCATPPSDAGGQWTVDAKVKIDGASRIIHGTGATTQTALLSALCRHLHINLALKDSSGHDTHATHNHDSKTASFIQVSLPSTSTTAWGVGVSSDNETSRLRAIVSAANTALDVLPHRPQLYLESGIRTEYPRYHDASAFSPSR